MSTNPRIYLDYNATAPLTSAAREAMQEVLSEVGNPSSVHAEGRRARDRVEHARTHVAILLDRPREQVVFTSGGTEANTLGISTLALVAEQRGLPRIAVTSPLEHPSLLGAVRALAHRGWTIRMLDVSGAGAVAREGLEGAGLVALAAVNHELGTVTDPAVYRAARGGGALLHVDAVQAAGKRPLGELDADSVAISAHKIGGPQGVGAVALALPDAMPVIEAGHQERGRRAGTENTLGIVGFGAAAAAVELATWPAVAALGDRLEHGIARIEGTRIHGAGTPRVGGTVNAGFAGALGESIVIALDLEGIAVSTGAACTSGSIQPSAVLRGLGQTPEAAREAVRFSLGRATSSAEVDRVLAVLPAVVARSRRHR